MENKRVIFDKIFHYRVFYTIPKESGKRNISGAAVAHEGFFGNEKYLAGESAQKTRQAAKKLYKPVLRWYHLNITATRKAKI
ncbi:MAG: hypothetical protein ACI4Q7_03585, partial [Candidatus Avelusimicrobium sp.]